MLDKDLDSRVWSRRFCRAGLGEELPGPPTLWALGPSWSRGVTLSTLSTGSCSLQASQGAALAEGPHLGRHRRGEGSSDRVLEGQRGGQLPELQVFPGPVALASMAEGTSWGLSHSPCRSMGTAEGSSQRTVDQHRTRSVPFTAGGHFLQGPLAALEGCCARGPLFRLWMQISDLRA